MTLTIHDLAQKFAEDVNSGELDWGDYESCPAFASGALLCSFNERLASEGADFLAEFAGLDWSRSSWPTERMARLLNRVEVPSEAELEERAGLMGVEPSWLLIPVLKDNTGKRGWAILIETVPYCDGGPLFEVAETFADECALLEYLKTNWPGVGH